MGPVPPDCSLMSSLSRRQCLSAHPFPRDMGHQLGVANSCPKCRKMHKIWGIHPTFWCISFCFSSVAVAFRGLHLLPCRDAPLRVAFEGFRQDRSCGRGIVDRSVFQLLRILVLHACDKQPFREHLYTPLAAERTAQCIKSPEGDC